MKRIINTILFVAMTFFCKGQTQNLPIYIDFNVIISMTDSLLRLNVHEVIVIQSNKEFHNLKSADNLFTFICWEQNEKYFVCIVSRDKVYSTVEFNGNQIFNFSNKKETFVTKNEQTLKFTPPLTNQNVVFYISKSLQGYLEQ